jgi:GAF domain-containing protein
METPGAGEINHRLAFLKTLQVVTNKIHATSNADEIMLEMSQDICNLFNCDRLTIYVLSEDKQSIVQDGAQLVQGHSSADFRAERCRLCGGNAQGREYPRRL